MRASLAKLALLGSAATLTSASNLRSSTTTTPAGAEPYSHKDAASFVLRKFFARHASIQEGSDSAYPLWSTRRRVRDDGANVLFSFTLPRKDDGNEEGGRRLDVFDLDAALAAAEGRPVAAAADGDEVTIFAEDKVKTEEVATEDHAGEKDHPTEAHDDHAGSQAKAAYDAHGSATHSDGHDSHSTHADGHGDGHGAHDAAHEMVVHVTYEDIYAIFLFLIVATGAGIFTAKLGMPALVGEIFVGFLMGPPLADFVPFPEALVLVGEIGLIMLLLEAGVELDVAQLRETGLRALGIGFTGTLLPLGVGMGLAMVSGSTSSLKSAMAVGASFSPTSLGVAASALKAGKMLDTPVGQLIVASCVVDDILALVLLSMFKVLVKDNPPLIQYFLPIISSVGFLIVLGGSAVTWIPKFIEGNILSKCKAEVREYVMFSIMAVILLAYLPLLNYTQASYLMGAFLCGCIFSQIEHAHHQFMHSTHQLMMWLLRVFFAASIGFQVPVKQFSDPYVIGWGFILYLCVAAKLPLALYVPQFEDFKPGAGYNPFLRDRLITGLSMTCRGEMSFIIAAFALGEGMFSAQMYAAIVWAVLLSCITSPFMLLNLIKYFNKKQLEYLAATNPIKLAKDTGDGMTPLFLHIRAKAPAAGGLQEQFRALLNEHDLEVLDRRTNRRGRGLDAVVQTDLYVRDGTMSVRLQKIAAQREIKRALAAAMSLTFEEARLLSDAAERVYEGMGSDATAFFARFDTNRDGEVSVDELRAGLEETLHVELTKRQARKIMDLYDDSGDGALQEGEMVNFDAFRARLRSVMEGQRESAVRATLALDASGHSVGSFRGPLASNDADAHPMKKSASSASFGRLSTNSLTGLVMDGLEEDRQRLLKESAAEQDAIIERGEYLEGKLEEALGPDSEVVVDVWNPWPWMEVLDRVAEHYDVDPEDDSPENVKVFEAVFDRIDADGGGEIDQEEMYETLHDAGLDITEEGVMTLCQMIDEDGNGDIDREEWKATVEFYFELKREEAEMARDQEDAANAQRKLRARKLLELGTAAQRTRDDAPWETKAAEGGTAMQIETTARVLESDDDIAVGLPL